MHVARDCGIQFSPRRSLYIVMILWHFLAKGRTVKALQAFQVTRTTPSFPALRVLPNGKQLAPPAFHLPASPRSFSSRARLSAAEKPSRVNKSTSPESSWKKDLNPAQVEAVTKPLYSITRVVAGPGSGKTRVLTSRIAYLLDEDPKARVLAVTFTRKAAMEMQQRLEGLLKHSDRTTLRKSSTQASTNDNTIIAEEEYSSEGSSSPTFIRDLARVTLGTFHKTCADILRYNGNLLASLPSIKYEMLGRNATLLDGGFAIMDQSDQLRIMKECLKENNIDLKKTGGAAGAVMPLDVLNALSDIKSSINEGKDPFEATSNKKPIPKPREIALKIYRYYRETMLSNNLLDFDDLIYLAREMLTERQEVRQQLHRRWTHILVDEYQDTSRAQIDLVRLWTSSSLLVVGDGDQSIYSWRGADPNSLSTFEDEFKSFLGEIETVHLTDNYRSTSNIVTAAQKVIASGEPSLAESLRQGMTPRRGSGATPRIVACGDGKAEANFVVKSIQKKLESGEYNPGTTVAILYRTNIQSRELEEACVNNNLPYVILGKATSFYKRREVKDCLCYLRWLHNGRDKGSMLRAIQTPSRGIGDKAIEQFEYYCSLVNDACRSAGKPRPSLLDILLSFPHSEEEGMPLRKDAIATRPLKLLTEFSKQMLEAQNLAFQEPVEKVLEAVIKTFDLMAHFDKVSDSKDESQERQGNVQELQRATTRYSKDGPALQSPKSPDTVDMESFKSPLGAFLDDVALVTELSDGAESEAAEGGSGKKRFVVSLMTIHASKGMEFDAVFVTGNEDYTFPTAQAIQAGKDSVKLAEECRLCYVAITRAKTELFLTWRKQAFVFAGSNGMTLKKKNRSRFLDSLVAKKKDSKAPKSPKEPTSKKTAVTLKDLPPSLRRPTPSFRKAPQSNGERVQSYSNSVRPRPQKHPVSSPSREGSPGKFSTRSDNSTPRQMQQPPKWQAKPTRKPSRPQAPMDSTWFFPVGSAVIHKVHGRGLVLNPPPSNNLRVLVKFENGRRMDFPAHGDDLKPDF